MTASARNIRGYTNSKKSYECSVGWTSDDQGQKNAMTMAEAMDILSAASQDHTVYSEVFNATTGEIEIALLKDFDKTFTFELEMR